MNLEYFSKIDGVALLSNVENQAALKKEITNISVVVSSGNLFWVNNDAFVFIIKDFMSDDMLKKIIISLISKKITGCCIIHRNNMAAVDESTASLLSMHSLPLFCFIKNSHRDNLWKTVLSPLIGTDNLQSFFEQQLKNNIICLMNSEYFNLKNLTAVVGLLLQHELFVLSGNIHMLSSYSPDMGEAALDLPLIKWSEELSGWNICQTGSLDPMVFEYNASEYYCFPMKTSNNIIGYIYIEKYNQRRGSLNTYFMAEILPYFILCIINSCKNDLMSRKSVEEYLRYVLYGLYTDEDTLKAETAYYNLDYSMDRYVWILQIQPLNGNKYSFENNIPDAVLAQAKQLTAQVFYQNLFVPQKSQIISIHIKSEKHNERVLDKFQVILHELEMQCPEYSFHIGISRAYSDMYKLKYAYEDATFSLIMGKTLFSNSNKKVFCYDDLLIYHLLYQQISNPILERLYNNTIKKIKQYDQEKQDQLYETLKELIRLDFNLNQAHENLYIHRNTLYQRIKKVERIIGMSIKSLETKLLLQLGLKLDDIHNVINHQKENG